MDGLVEADVPWLVVEPHHLDPHARTQRVRVRVPAGGGPWLPRTGVVRVRASGQDVAVTFRFVSLPWRVLVGVAVVILVATSGLIVGGVWWVMR